MPTYSSLKETAETLHTLIVDGMIKKIAFKQFEQDRGVAVRSVLPDKSDEYTFESHGFNGRVNPDKRRLKYADYNDTHITVNKIIAKPQQYKQIVEPLYDAWWDTFGELTMANQPGHPGEPPIEKDELKDSIDTLSSQRDLLVADPMLSDLVAAIEDKHYHIVAWFLNIDEDPNILFHPGGQHELTDLFTQGDIHIVYQDSDLLLLKPEYTHESMRQALLEDRPGFRVRTRGENLELAFVVGVDDTPTGLFAHSVDGTNLDVDQSVTREQIHDVMGFDYNYTNSDLLDCSPGDRIRLQGDLAVEYVSNDPQNAQDTSRCNLPIDNHLAILNHGELAEGESKSEEPITVHLPQTTTLNIMHDEHETVSTDLPHGTYRFYLLPRGFRPRDQRPTW